MSDRKRHGLRAGLVTIVGVLALVAAGCGGDDGGGASVEGLGSSLEEI
jgi:hypothetical protein